MNRPGSGVCSSRCISGWDAPIRSDTSLLLTPSTGSEKEFFAFHRPIETITIAMESNCSSIEKGMATQLSTLNTSRVLVYGSSIPSAIRLSIIVPEKVMPKASTCFRTLARI